MKPERYRLLARIGITLVTCFSALLPAKATNEVECLRVLAVRPDCFEYQLMSAMSTGTGGVRLVFNHVSGLTEIVRPGEKLGPYTVSEFRPTTQRIFNPTINAEQEKKGGEAVLLRGDGTKN